MLVRGGRVWNDWLHIHAAVPAVNKFWICKEKGSWTTISIWLTVFMWISTSQFFLHLFKNTTLWHIWHSFLWIECPPVIQSTASKHWQKQSTDPINGLVSSFFSSAKCWTPRERALQPFTLAVQCQYLLLHSKFKHKFRLQHVLYQMT